MRDFVFFHSADLDGKASGAIARYALGRMDHTVITKGINYGYPFPLPVKGAQPEIGDDVYFVDFTPTQETYLHLLAKGCSVFLIDHHEHSPAFAEANSVPGKVEQGKAACELVWNYFFPDKPVPTWLALLSAYDVFNKERFDWETKTLPFQYAVRAVEDTWPNGKGYAWWVQWIEQSYWTIDLDYQVDTMINLGRTVLTYQRDLDKRLMYYAFDLTWRGYRVLASNGAPNSLAFHSKYDPAKHDMFMSFNFNGQKRKWSVSLYSPPDKETDVFVVCQDMGGGGHKKAGGFDIDNIQTILGGN